MSDSTRADVLDVADLTPDQRADVEAVLERASRWCWTCDGFCRPDRHLQRLLGVESSKSEDEQR